MSVDEHVDPYIMYLARLNHFYHDVFNQNINMGDFYDRLKLQKLIYILSYKNIHFNYDFTWYIHGPYSSKLARDGYSYMRKVNEVRHNYPPNEEERKVVEGVRNARNMLNDPNRAELIASFLYLTDRYGSEETARQELLIRKPRFSENQIREVMYEWSNMTN